MMKTLVSILAAGILLLAVTCAEKAEGPSSQISAASCGSCHQSPPADSGHAKHVAWANYKCGSCHQGYVWSSADSAAGTFAINAALHKNGDTNVVFSTPWKNNGQASFTKATKQCNNVYCHGGIPQGTNASIHWNGTDKVNLSNCRACHNLDTISPGIYAGHYGHSRFGKKDAQGNQIKGANVQYCFNCHGTSLTDSMYNVGTGSVDGMRHIDGVSNPGDCKDCHAPDWTNWNEYLTKYPGTQPF